MKAPPFVLPGEHFAAALVFLSAGALGLVFAAPLLAAGMYATPRVVAVTHLFTLGWITTSIMGALYQFLPVALGEPIASVRVAHVTFAAYVPGLVLFVAGMSVGASGAMVIGAAVFGSALLVFAANLGVTLVRAKRRDVTWWALACADVFLVTTVLFGVALAGNLRWGFLGAQRYGALGTHLHVALAGWVGLVMIGVAHRLLPMFLLSHGAGDRFARAAVALVASGVATLALLHHAPPLFSRHVPAVLIAAGFVCFLVQARRFYRHRNRPTIDPGMRLAAAALAILGGGMMLSLPVLLAISSARVQSTYVLVLVLGISLFVAAHYYKIVPFLVWFHRFGPLAGKQAVPRVNELYSARAAALAGVMLVAGVVGLAAAVSLGAAWGARLAAMVLACGVAVEGTQMMQLARRKP